MLSLYGYQIIDAVSSILASINLHSDALAPRLLLKRGHNNMRYDVSHCDDLTYYDDNKQ